MRADEHFEPYLHLVDVGPDRALVAWGGFWFRRDAAGGRWRVLDDAELHEVDPGRTGSMGASAESYGAAAVEVSDAAGRVVAGVQATEATSAWVEGLEPDTCYRYRVTVDGEPWAEGERWDWGSVPRGGLDLRPGGRSYVPTFRTHPDPDVPAALDFAVLGDYGVGTVADTEAGRRQRRVAAVLDRLTDDPGIRLVVTVGDNVYRSKGRRGSTGSGGQDADWFGSFYQPYRYALARVPLYPAVGNHDTSDEESGDDRAQIRDNFHTDTRFASGTTASRSSLDPGMCYRFGYGADVEFVCIDTSLAGSLPTEHFFEDDRHRQFLEEALSPPVDGGPRWRIPFSHHPAYCAGPSHANTEAMIEHLVPMFERAGVRVALAGHEHNFQLAEQRDITYVVSGAGGKLREDAPEGFAEAGTRAWAGQAHLLLGRIDDTALSLTPIAAVRHDAVLEPVTPFAPDGSTVEVPIVVSLPAPDRMAMDGGSGDPNPRGTPTVT